MLWAAAGKVRPVIRRIVRESALDDHRWSSIGLGIAKSKPFHYLDKLHNTADGDGSLLDHSMIMYGAALSDANLHRYDDLPILLVAGGVNGIKGGQHIKYPSRTPLTNLLVTMLNKAGVPNVERLGDSTGKLELVAAAAKLADASQPKTL
jgi:hypothetical protein